MKILIVDDDLAITRLLHDFLVLSGYHVDCAANGFDALKFIEDRCYNLVIVDYQMPELNGIEFVKKLRERWTSLPVFAMSASDVKDMFLGAGANFFISKPIDLNVLAKEIELIVLRMNA